MGRQRAIVAVLILAALGGAVAWWRAPPPPPGVPCPEGAVALGADGVARCGAGRALPAGQALTLGQKFDCNAATEAELALVPGVGAAVARAIVEARGPGFRDWAQVDAVPGVGETRLQALQAACELRVADAGL